MKRLLSLRGSFHSNADTQWPTYVLPMSHDKCSGCCGGPHSSAYRFHSSPHASSTLVVIRWCVGSSFMQKLFQPFFFNLSTKEVVCVSFSFFAIFFVLKERKPFSISSTSEASGWWNFRRLATERELPHRRFVHEGRSTKVVDIYWKGELNEAL